MQVHAGVLRDLTVLVLVELPKGLLEHRNEACDKRGVLSIPMAYV